MSEIRINREEIKSITRDRRNERADAADTNKSGKKACDGKCENGACEWHKDT